MDGERIRIEITGDSRDLQAAAVAARTAIQGLGRDVKMESQQVRVATKDHDSFAQSLSKVDKGLLRAHVSSGLFSKTLSLIKWPAMIAGAGMAAQALSALAAGGVALAGALRPLSGLLVAYPSLLSAVGQGLITVKLATSGLSQALAGNKKALAALTPEARKFVDTLKSYKPLLTELRQASQKGLFDGATKGLAAARQNFGVFKGIVAETSNALGDLAMRAGKLVGSKAWGRDLKTIGAENARTITNLGGAGLHLANVLRQLLVTSKPLIDWLTKSADGWAKNLDQQSRVARKSGELNHFFETTRKTLTVVVDGVGHFGHALLDIIKLGKPLGDSILKSLDQTAKRFDEWTKSAAGRNTIRTYFEQAKPAIFELGRLVHDITLDFLKLGQGTQVAPLIQKLRTQLLPTLVSLVNQTTKAFGPALINALIQWGKLLGDLAGTSGPLTLYVKLLGQVAKFLDAIFKAVPGTQSAIVTMLGFAGVLKAMQFTAAITGVSKLVKLFRTLKGAEEAAAGVNVAGGIASGVAGGAAAGTGGGLLAKILGPAAAASLRATATGLVLPLTVAVTTTAAANKLAGGDYLHSQTRQLINPTIFDKVKGLFGGGMSKDETAIAGFADKAQGALNKLSKAADGRALLRLADQARTFAHEASALGHQDWAANLKALADQAAQTGRPLAQLQNNIGFLRHHAATDIQTLRKVFESNLATISERLGDGTAAGQKKLGDNLRATVGNIKSLMRDGVISTRDGMAEIEKIYAETLLHYGFTPKEALNVAKGHSPTGGPDEGSAGPTGTGTVIPGVGKVNSKGQKKAVGGYIAGQGMQDTVPAMLAPGEAVLNRHQQGPVETALRATYGMGLTDLFAAVSTPHYMATGGLVPKITVNGPASDLHTLVQGGLNKTRGAANSILSAIGNAAGGPPSGGSAAPSGVAKKWLTQALKITGHFSSANLGALFARMMQESGGNPHAINLWDSNAKAGHPSKGLLQTIDGTFSSYMMPGHGDIWNPIDNAIAAIRYMFARYGHIMGASGSGYARGGFARMARGGLAGIGAKASSATKSYKGPAKSKKTPKSKKNKGTRIPSLTGNAYGGIIGSVNNILEHVIPGLQERYSYTSQQDDLTSFQFIVSPADGSAPYVDWGAVHTRVGELQHLYGLQQEALQTMGPALGWLQKLIPKLVDGIRKRHALIKDLRTKIETNLKKIKKLTKDLTDEQRRTVPAGKGHAGERTAKTKRVQSLQDQIKALKDDNQHLGGARDSVGSGGAIGTLVKQASNWQSSLGAARTDIVNLQGVSGIGGSIGDTKFTLAQLGQQLGELSPDALAQQLSQAGGASSSGTNSVLDGLLTQWKDQQNLGKAIGAGQFAVFQSFLAPLMGGGMDLSKLANGRFDRGGHVPSTGLYLLHRDEHVSPDPSGGYGSQIVAKAASPEVNVQLTFRDNSGALVQLVDARIDGRAAHVADQQLGRKARVLRVAPGG